MGAFRGAGRVIDIFTFVHLLHRVLLLRLGLVQRLVL